MRLAQKSIVVTGATGIAGAGARRAAAEGAAVFVIARDDAQCRDLVADITSDGGEAGWAGGDLTDESAAEAAFESAIGFLGRIDGLFAVAGGSGRRHGDGPLHELSLEAWDRTFEMNSRPMFLAAREVIRDMRGRGGSVVLVGSVLAVSPVPDLFATHAYAAVKGSTNALTIALASYYASDGIRVNTIAPGLVRTPMSERAAADPATVEFSVKKQPLTGGFLDAGHVADTAVFLLSDESSQVTGQVIAVDGGWSVAHV
jgi:NAD(P)-dependent dehydrogenase (short-subunit alcohol dehydrogenase family)